MAHQIDWNRTIMEEFINEAILSEDEENILRTRVAGLSRQQQAMELNMSLQSIDRAIRRIKDKYDKVAEYDKILPKRRLGAIEKRKS